MKNKLIIANLKMYMSCNDTISYFKELEKCDKKNLVVCPTSIYIPYFLQRKFEVGIQNVSIENKGAYTGEISALQASELGVKYALIGHSEIRNNFNETNDAINKKIKQCLCNELKVILCIGETYAQYKNKMTKYVLKEQLNACLNGINDLSNIIIAYEPIWAIGTDDSADLEVIIDCANYIKQILNDNLDIKILYGGSINDDNIEYLSKIKEIDGFLIGNASTNPIELKKMIEVVDHQ